jgi:hypothetical protein
VWVTETALTSALNLAYTASQISLFGIVVGIALLLSGIRAGLTRPRTGCGPLDGPHPSSSQEGSEDSGSLTRKAPKNGGRIGIRRSSGSSDGDL